MDFKIRDQNTRPKYETKIRDQNTRPKKRDQKLVSIIWKVVWSWVGKRPL